MMDSKDLSPKVSPTHRKTLAQEMTHADKMFERAALIKVFNALDDDGNGVLTTGENNKHNRRMMYEDNDDGRNSILGNLQEYKRGGW